jgi:branched-chain amino acid transport system substrate-binding protein
MSNCHFARPLTRRTLLRTTATLAGALTVSPLLQACGTTPTAGTTQGTTPAASKEVLKIGALVPLSGNFAGLAEDMLAGMRLYLDSIGNEIAGRPVQLIEDDTEAKPDVGLTKARKQLDQDGVALCTGIVSSAVALGLRDMFDQTKNILVISNAGANDITRARKSKYIFRTSFSNWQTCYPAGPWVAANIGKRAFCAAPDYAAGKEDIAAFTEGFTKAGGQIVGEAYPQLGTTLDYQPYLTAMQEANPDVVFSFFSGADAVRFVTQYEEFGLKGKIPLTGPGFLVETDVLPQQGAAAEGIRTCLHYSALLDTPENKKFVAEYQAKFNEVPSVFAVQAYDAMQLIATAITVTQGDTTDKDKLVAAMEAATITSPRGPFKVDPATHNPIMKIYMREVKKLEDGTFGNVVFEDLGEFPDPGA